MKLFQVWVTGILGYNLVTANSKAEIEEMLRKKGYLTSAIAQVTSVTIIEVTPFTIDTFPRLADYHKV